MVDRTIWWIGLYNEWAYMVDKAIHLMGLYGGLGYT